MSNPLDRLRGVKEKADATDEIRHLYQRFIAKAKSHLGWTEADVSEYAASVKVLMTGSDEAVMALYPSGLFRTAEEVKQAAINFWRSA